MVMVVKLAFAPVPFGSATSPGCASQCTPCGGRTGGCLEQEAWRGSVGLFLPLESPGVLVVSLCSEAVGLFFYLMPCDFLVQETLCFN